MRQSNEENQTLNQQDKRTPRFILQDYALLLKPRVMSLVVFTAFVGLVLAPGSIDPKAGFVAVVCIAIGAGASGAINMWYDQDIDIIMKRTMNRPIPAGRVPPIEALIFGTALSIIAVGGMSWMVNNAAAGLLAFTILYYVFIYTIWLKRRTPLNIVIGGAAGAFPPMIGWTAVTGDISMASLALFAIIFLWTPPHTWALALFRRGDYEAAGVPMMPVVVGEKETKRQMLIYTALLIPASLAPVYLQSSGLIYGVIASGLGIEFWRRCWRLWKADDVETASPLFFFSIFYLTAIFAVLIIDKFIFIPVF